MSDYIELLKKCLCASLYEESAWQRVDGPMASFLRSTDPLSYVIGKAKHAIIKALRRRDLQLIRVKPYKPELREQGMDWPCFGFTMTGIKRLDALQSMIETILDDRVPGDFIETGVWRGGTCIFIRALLREHGDTSRIVWCADSFEGMPVPNEADTTISNEPDFSDRSYLNASLEQVQANFKKFGLLDDQVRFLNGWFRETLPDAPIETLSLLRLDGDLYESTMTALHHLYPKLNPGGFVIVDDYENWLGCRTAVGEYRAEHQINETIQHIDQHAVFWRKSH